MGLHGDVGGIPGAQSAFGKVRSGFEQQGAPVRFTVNEVMGDTGPQIFVAIAHESMSELDLVEPGGLEAMLAETHGQAEALQIIRTFETYLTPTASRIWVLRPDLSHMPGM